MELIRSRLGDQVGDGAAGAAVFGRIVAAHDLDFLQSVERRLDSDGAEALFVIVHAVNHVVVVHGALAVGRKRHRLALIVGTAAGASRDHTRLEADQVVVIPAVGG